MDQELIVTDPDRVKAQALVQLGGSGMFPICIRHALLPFERKVLTLLENWTTPTYWAVLGTPQGRGRFRVRVSGLLPGRRYRPVSS
jgi:hypothetical protein